MDPFMPTLKAPGTQRLKLKYDKLVSSFAFISNLRRYTLGASSAAAVRVLEGLIGGGGGGGGGSGDGGGVGMQGMEARLVQAVLHSIEERVAFGKFGL
jgi:hypothetical protein